MAALMLSSPAMLARASARPATVRARAAAKATAPMAKSNTAKMPTSERVKSVGASVLTGVVAAGLASAMAPEPALAVSLRDPVFGDIEVWQFIVLTAGYWWGIEFYLDRKYDDDKPKNPTDIMPKVSAEKKSTFAEANATKEAENAE
jgi:hypothetical protein